MRLNEFTSTNEGLDKTHKAAIKGMHELSGDQYYGLYKTMNDVAGHDGKKQTAPKGNSDDEVSDKPFAYAYTDEEEAMIKGADPKAKKITSSKSEEVKEGVAEAGVVDTIKTKAKQFGKYMTEPQSPHNNFVRDRANNIDKIRKQKEKDQGVAEGKDIEVMHDGENIGTIWRNGREVQGEHTKSGMSWAGGTPASMAQHLKNHHDSWIEHQARKKQQGVAEDYEHDEESQGTTEPYGGIYIYLEDDGDEVFVQAMYKPASDGSTEMGYVLFVKDGEYLMPQDLEVHEKYQRQGVATTMYDYVKSKGYKIRRSGQQTDAGAAFWDKQKPGKNVWEQSVSEGADDPYKGTTPFNGKIAARNGHRLGKTYNNPHSPKYHKDSYAAWDRDYNNETARLKKQGVAEGSVNDYFKRRKDEEDRIAGTKAPAKRKPRQTDYEKKRKEQGVSEGNYDDNRTGFSRGPRDDERHDLDVPRPTIYALKINGKIWQKDGNVVTFFTKERALAARNSMLNKRPELEIGLVQRQD